MLDNLSERERRQGGVRIRENSKFHYYYNYGRKQKFPIKCPLNLLAKVRCEQGKALLMVSGLLAEGSGRGNEKVRFVCGLGGQHCDEIW